METVTKNFVESNRFLTKNDFFFQIFFYVLQFFTHALINIQLVIDILKVSQLLGIVSIVKVFFGCPKDVLKKNIKIK